ncbi:prepilin peptidase [Georgenia alba]|uniref:Prepilin peptidase n=1 Tax=Georgenia alba TaxID=2233858 RepID=A0ABW2QEX1_9MICO
MRDGAAPPRPVLGVVAVAAAGAAALGLRSEPVAVLVAGALLAGVAVVLALVDARTHRLPDRLVITAYVVTAVPLLVGAAVGSPGLPVVGGAALAGVVTAACFLGLGLARVGGLGLGDVKLSGVLGLWLGLFGWEVAVAGPLTTFVLAGLWALVLVATRRADLRSHVALGPWMVLGTALATSGHLAGWTG